MARMSRKKLRRRLQVRVTIADERDLKAWARQGDTSPSEIVRELLDWKRAQQAALASQQQVAVAAEQIGRAA